MIALIFSLILVQPPASNGWTFDELIHVNGSNFKGLILAETNEGIRFQVVTRKPGRPTVTLTTIFSKEEIAKLNRLPDSERAVLKTRLSELDPTGKGERERMQSLTLAPSPWLGRADAARKYESDYFTLVSNAPEEVTRRAAVRLELLFAAFRRYFPPANANGRPTTIELSQTQAEYRALLGPLAPRLLNPAIYDPRANRIVCGSELLVLGENLKATQIHHERQRLEIDQYEADVRKLYKDQKVELDRFLATAARQRQRIVVAEAANERAFESATKQMFAVMYHETFHAYAATFAFQDAPLPRWMNEGLAQIFETAIVEAGELHVGHADEPRLKVMREWLKPGGAGLMPLSELVRTKSDAFLAQHADAKAHADRAYLSSWAAAHYLLFHRATIENDRFDAYLKSIKGGEDPIKAFERWQGKSINEIETDWRDYLNRLKPDGTLNPKN
ncbi:MAG: DUF1570 domain-containing protein [Gemmataceae bacterium]